MRRARTCRWLRMRPYRVLLRGQGVFFAAQSSADCITSMAGFDLRQAQPGLLVERVLEQSKSQCSILPPLRGMRFLHRPLRIYAPTPDSAQVGLIFLKCRVSMQEFDLDTHHVVVVLAAFVNG